MRYGGLLTKSKMVMVMKGYTLMIYWDETDESYHDNNVNQEECRPSRTQKDERSSIRACLCTSDFCNALPEGEHKDLDIWIGDDANFHPNHTF